MTSIWEQYRDILKSKRTELMSEYRTLAKMGTGPYLKDRGLVPSNKSKTYFFNLDGKYLDMKAPVRVVLDDDDRPSSFQSSDIYKALNDLCYPVVYNPSAIGGAPLDGDTDEREAPRYLALARPQQAKFRKAVSAHFGHKCWVTDCEVLQALEAAHITPYSQCTEDPKGDHVSNGLLLRRDLHALFDAGILSFKTGDSDNSYVVKITQGALSGEYSKLHGQILTYPAGQYAKDANERLNRRCLDGANPG